MKWWLASVVILSMSFVAGFSYWESLGNPIPEWSRWAMAGLLLGTMIASKVVIRNQKKEPDQTGSE